MNAVPQFRDLTEDEISAALEYIDYEDRDTWVRMAMCVKHELGPNGFAIWDRWSQKSSAYSVTDARDVWKSAKESGTRGTVTIGTLIAEAQAFGFKMDDRDRQPISQDEIDRRERERKARVDADKAERERRQARAASMAAAIWEAGEDIDGAEHPYLERKGVRSFGLRVGEYRGIPNTLLVPLRLIDGSLVSMQGIFERASPMMEGRDRDYLPGGQKWGAMHLVGGKPSGQQPTILIGSGYATCASAHMATGYPAFVAFDDGNMKNVAVAVRNQYPLANIVILADDDCWHADPKKPNSGRVNGGQAMHQCAGIMALPRFSDTSSKPTDFNDLHMLDGLDAVRSQIEAALPKKAANDNGPMIPLDATVSVFDYPHQGNPGKPQNTYENLEFLMRQYGITARYNVMKKDVDVTIPGRDFGMDSASNLVLAELGSICSRNSMPKSDLDSYIKLIGNKNRFNPAEEFIGEREWDGVSRLPQLCATLKTAAKFDRNLMELMLRKWLISAVAAVLRPQGFWSKGVLVLQGPQSLGKTAWIKALLPPAQRGLVKIGAIIDPANKDTISSAIGHWIVELGELDGTFKKADIARLKAFISQDIDQLRRPYDRLESSYQRRTVFCASVNPEKFLADETGNVRWWTIPVTDLNVEHGIDVQQLWAEVATLYESGERWWLEPDEEAQLEAANREHESTDPVEEQILSAFDWDGSGIGKEMTATEVLLAIGYDKPSRPAATHASTILKKLAGEPKRKNSGRYFSMPAMLRGARRAGGDDDLRPF